MEPSGSQGGQSAPLDSEKFAKNQEKEGENQGNVGKRRENREKEEKSGTSVPSLCPTWQIRLATLLMEPPSGKQAHRN